MSLLKGDVMTNEIIKILKIKNLYDEKNDLSKPIKNSNKIDEFLKTYKTNPSKKQKIPYMSRKDGFLNLEEIPFIISNKNTNSFFNKWCLLNNGTKLLLKKRYNHKYNEAELLIMYFLKQLNMPCANYDIATYKNEEYLICPSFLRNKEKIVNPFNNQPIIKDGYELMKQYDGQTHFIKTCFVDRIYGNIDRFPCNYGIITGNVCNGKKTKPRLCPLFDNVDFSSVLIREEKYGFFPSINENINSCEDVFKYLLDYEIIMNWTDTTLKKANLYKAAEKMKEEKEILINNETYQEYESFFKDSESLINNALKEKQKSFKIKLT